METRQLTRTAMFTALACVTAVMVRFMPEALVPFSMLPMIAVLSGAILGWKYGSYSMLAYCIIGLVGIPVFASAPFGGLTYVLKPTFGFIIGNILAAMVTGIIVNPKRPNVPNLLGAMFLGLAAIYLVGIPYLYGMVHYGLGKMQFTLWNAVQTGFLPYIGFDLFKVLLGTLVAKQILDRYQELFTIVTEEQPE